MYGLCARVQLFLPGAGLPVCRCPGSLQPAGPLSAVAAEKEAAHTHSAHTSFCPDTCRSIQVQHCHNLEAPF